jgi:HAD superfamily hydrolase (TIGR01509 family)
MINVIFDFGNVVIQWRPYRALSGIFATEAEMDQTLAKIGFFDWNLKQDQGRSWEDAVAAAERDTPDHAHIFRAYAEGLRPAHEELIPGTSELIQSLHNRGVALFGLTNAAQASFNVVKSVAPVIELMRDVVVSADEGIAKPDPKIFELCLDRNGLERSETMFVDDSLANCEAAETVGIAAHHFVDAAGLEQDLQSRGLL